MPKVSSRIYRTDVAVIDLLYERYSSRIHDLINLAPGAPPFQPSDAVKDAASSSVHYNAISDYGDVLGWLPLRSRWLELILHSWDGELLAREAEALRTSKSDNYGLELMVTAGANQGFFNLVLALCDPCDEVILFLPYYFSHYCALVMADVKPVVVPCDPKTLLPSGPEAVRSHLTSKTKAVVLVSPGNPSGVVAPASLVDALVSLCRENDVWLIIDEAYRELSFGVGYYSPPVLQGVIKIYTMSKVYGMAGWRVGALVYPQHLSFQLRKVQDTIPTHATMMSQVMAFHALKLDTPLIEARIQFCNQTRNQLANALARTYARAGTKALNPFVPGNGALYFFLPTAPKQNGGTQENQFEDVVDVFVQVGNVLVVSGAAFGMPKYVRVSYGSLKPLELEPAVVGLTKALEFIFSIQSDSI